MSTPNPWQSHASLSTQSTAKTLAELGFTRHERTSSAVIQAVGGDVRFVVNTGTPTASAGMLIADGQSVELTENEIDGAKFITGSGTPKLEIASFVQ